MPKNDCIIGEHKYPALNLTLFSLEQVSIWVHLNLPFWESAFSTCDREGRTWALPINSNWSLSNFYFPSIQAKLAEDAFWISYFTVFEKKHRTKPISNYVERFSGKGAVVFAQMWRKILFTGKSVPDANVQGAKWMPSIFAIMPIDILLNGWDRVVGKLEQHSDWKLHIWGYFHYFASQILQEAREVEPIWVQFQSGSINLALNNILSWV